MAGHNEIGRKGENLAVDFLKNKGHIILKLNYVFQRAEIDIISEIKDGVIVFSEVKTLSTYKSGNPELAVTKSKQNQIAKAAINFIEDIHHQGEVRYDIIAITLNEKEKIFHIEDAFFPNNE